ncbi:hypothetical protein [Spirosoma aerophilum]
MNLPRWLFLSLCSVPLLVYHSFVFINSQNIPFTDDLAIVANLYDLHTAQTLNGFTAVLLSFHNEHRLLLPRLITWGLRSLNGGIIDFRHWVWFGNSLLLIVPGVLFYVFRSYRKPYGFFLPVLILLFQPLFLELTEWGMASLQNIGVLAVAAITLFYICRSDTSPIRLLITFLLTGVTLFTGANGLLLIGVVGLVLLIRRQYVQTVLWMAAGGLAIWAYWQGFMPDVHAGKGTQTTFSVSNTGLSLFGLAGSLVESQRYDFLSIGMGLIMLTAFTWVGIRRAWTLIGSPLVDWRTLFLLSYSLFLLLTMGVIALNRPLADVLHVSRYKIYPLLLLICLYLLLLEPLSCHKQTAMAILVVCIAFNSITYRRALPVIRVHQTELYAWLSRYQLTGQVGAPSPYMEQYYAQRLTAFTSQHLYQPPDHSKK